MNRFRSYSIHHGLSPERKFWARAFLVYVCVEALFVVLGYIVYSMNCSYCLQPVLAFVSRGVLDIFFTAALWFVLIRFHRRRKYSTVLINVVTFAGYFLLWISAKYLQVKSGVFQEPGVEVERNVFRAVIYNSWFDIGKYVLKLSAFYVLRFYIAYRESEQQRTELAVLNKDLQLNLLKQQLSPHFYFNTLNNLYGLSRNNSFKLPGALDQLSNIMRYVLQDCNQPKVLLAQEISFLQSYIALEKLRYEEDTVIDMEVTGKVNGQTILPLLLIQFVENGFKHGMKEKLERNWMKVRMDIREHDLAFSVDNSYYAAIPVEGIGLTNVKHRLNLQYGGKYDMQMVHENERFSLRLKLDLS